MVDLKTVFATVLCSIALTSSMASAQPAIDTAGRAKISMNTSWKYYKGDVANAQTVAFNDAGWTTVTLPHAIDSIPSDSFPRIYQGIVWYRKHFTPLNFLRNKEVYLEIGAAMQASDIYLNGTLLTSHCGGFQQFVMDLTGKLNWGADNVIACKLDNRDITDCIPGKTEATLDFHMFGGLYRDVSLNVYNAVHISDPMFVDKVASGGVYFTTANVTAASATVNVRTHVVNESVQSAACRVVSVLLDSTGSEAARITSDTVRIAANGENLFTQTGTVTNPMLWSPEWPYLYRLISRVETNGAVTDTQITRVGIRNITMSLTNGMSLNGKRYWLFGTNRHQEFPYLAFAVSANMQRREAVVLKNMGVTMVRHGHYPAHTAFLDACDELGLFVGEPIPGWQSYIGTNTLFVNSAYKAIQELIRRDRNHPCILMFECGLNESGSPAAFEQQCQTTAKAEFIGNQQFTSGDQSSWDIAYNSGSTTNMRYYREYGDWGFGGNSSTTRQKRGAGEQKLLQQAWNHYWDHNAAESGSWASAQNQSRNRLLGSGFWCFNDYNRGYYTVPCYAGAVDHHRLPKFTYLWAQSYRDPTADRKSALIETGPVVNIGNYWTTRTNPIKIVAWSNCEEVELFVNNSSIGRQGPDAGTDLNYNSATVAGYSGADGNGGYPWGGGCCRCSARPAFTFFNKTYAAGELKAIGYIGGAAVAQNIVRTPGAPANIVIECALNGVPLAANDEIFLYARIVDASGNPVPTATNQVAFSVTGPGRIIGINPIAAEAGIAHAILKTDSTASGTVTITATGSGVSPASTTVQIGSLVGTQRRFEPERGVYEQAAQPWMMLSNNGRGFVEKVVVYLPRAREMDLAVYDLAGNLVQRIAHEKQLAGYHTFAFNGARMPSGTHIVSLKVGGMVIGKQAIIVR